MKELTITGGARIGQINTTLPLATLHVTKFQLNLRSSIDGDLIFKTEDIISIEPFYTIPKLIHGIKINHCISEYNNNILFYTFKNPNELINKIFKTGFLQKKDLNYKEEMIVEKTY